MPAIYIIAALLVVLFLIGAYRAMGASATTEHDPGAVLGAVLAGADESARALGGTPAALDGSGGEPRAIRRRLEGCAQALERIAGTPVDEHLDEARSLLEHAVDELIWAARLAEAPGHARDSAVQTAATSLRDAASANLESARALLGA